MSFTPNATLLKTPTIKNPVINNKTNFTENQNTCPYATKSHISIDFHDASFITNPELTFQKLRDLAPIQQITLGDEFPAWLISRYNHITNILRDPRSIKSPDNLRTSTIEPLKGKTKRNTPPIYSEDSICLPKTHLNTLD